MKFRGHIAIIAARSAYLRGFIRMALQEHRETAAAAAAKAFSSNETNTNQTAARIDSNNSIQNTVSERVTMYLSGPACLNAVTFRSLVEYLYTDRVVVPAHKKKQLGRNR